MKRHILFTFIMLLILNTGAKAATTTVTFSDSCATLSLTGPDVDPGSPYNIEASGKNNLGDWHNALLYMDEHYSGYSSFSVINPSFAQEFGTFSGARTFKLTIQCGPTIHSFEERSVEFIVARKDLKRMAADICTAINALSGSAFKNNPSQRKNAFCNKIDEVIKLIESAEASTDPTAKKQYYQEAINKLQIDIEAKMDGYLGGDPKDDWITDRQSQENIFPKVQQLVAELVNLL